MNCEDVKHLAPLFLSGEISGDERHAFAAHLAACRSCEYEIEQQVLIDERLRIALAGNPRETPRVERRVRRQMDSTQSRRRWIATGAVAASLAAVAGSFGLLHLASVPKIYADAARDHMVEVVESQPRRWRTNPVEIESLAVQNGLSYSQAAGLAPVGYSLERAKICGLDGQRMLHLVFTNRATRYSLYVHAHSGTKTEVRVIQRAAVEVASFETGRFRALVATVGPSSECEQLARLTAARL